LQSPLQIWSINSFLPSPAFSLWPCCFQVK
jgi:hypothetical protein